MRKNYNTGEYLEKLFELECKRIKDSNFNYRRLSDTKSARNFIAAQPSDYFIADSGTCAHVELKSTNSKTRRLKSPRQMAQMRRWSMCGVHGYIIADFHELEEIHVVNVEELEPGKPSWVLCRQVGSMKDALEYIRLMMGR